YCMPKSLRLSEMLPCTTISSCRCSTVTGIVTRFVTPRITASSTVHPRTQPTTACVRPRFRILSMSPHAYYPPPILLQVSWVWQPYSATRRVQMTRAMTNSAPLLYSEADDELYQRFDVAQIRHLDWRMGVAPRPRERHINHAIGYKRLTVVPSGRHT